MRIEALEDKDTMATTAKIAKEAKTPKFEVRQRNRCRKCGRPRAYLRKFALCRLCFRRARASRRSGRRDQEQLVEGR